MQFRTLGISNPQINLDKAAQLANLKQNDFHSKNSDKPIQPFYLTISNLLQMQAQGLIKRILFSSKLTWVKMLIGLGMFSYLSHATLIVDQRTASKSQKDRTMHLKH